MKWISVEKELPPVEERVLVLTVRRLRGGGVFHNITCGFYEDGRVLSGESKACWDIDTLVDYDEVLDDWLVPEGWIEESITERDDYNCAVIGDEVTHWMPLPPLPMEEKEADK